VNRRKGCAAVHSAGKRKGATVGSGPPAGKRKAYRVQEDQRRSLRPRVKKEGSGQLIMEKVRRKTFFLDQEKTFMSERVSQGERGGGERGGVGRGNGSFLGKRKDSQSIYRRRVHGGRRMIPRGKENGEESFNSFFFPEENLVHELHNHSEKDYEDGEKKENESVLHSPSMQKHFGLRKRGSATYTGLKRRRGDFSRTKIRGAIDAGDYFLVLQEGGGEPSLHRGKKIRVQEIQIFFS